MIARRLLLLVAPIVFFIHEDQTKVRQRCKDRRPRPHHNASLSSPYPMPLLRALIRRQLRMQQRHLIAKRGHKLARHRRSQPDLRNQQQCRLSSVQCPSHRRKINRGLARSRHAIQKVRSKAALRHRRRNRAQRLHLRLIQRMLVRMLLSIRSNTAEMKLLGDLLHANQPTLHERAQRRLRNAFAAHCLLQVAHPHASAHRRQLRHHSELILIQLRQPLTCLLQVLLSFQRRSFTRQ